MQEKNENVFICPLGQDSQKDLGITIEQINCDSKTLSSLTQQNFPAILEKSLENEGKRSEPGETNVLELMLKEKARLEEESRRLDEEGKRLEVIVRIHIEKLAQETKKRNCEKQKANMDLRARVDMLETQIRELSILETPGESIAEKIDYESYPSSEVSQDDLLDYDQNAIAVEIIEEIK